MISKSIYMLALMMLVVACSQQKREGAVLEINQEDNGNTIAMVKGDTLLLHLEGNPTTGYTWEPENLDTEYLTMPTESEFVPSSSLKGAGGMYTFTFVAQQAGVTHLRLIYHRTFEQGVPPIQVFEVTLDIQD